MEPAERNFEKLQTALKQLGKVAVAFSSGVDSSFLLKVAHAVLGDNAAAITVRHLAFPQRELEEARAFCRSLGVRLIETEVDVLSVDGFAENPPRRCYLCKKAVFKTIKAAAEANGFPFVAEGSNVDDEGDFRPGMRAIKELGVKSPLREAWLTKKQIRALSKAQGLSTWDKPSYACLATRIPYGEPITPKKLKMIEIAEQTLFDLGFRQCRVRHHGETARIEIEDADFSRIVLPEIRTQINEKLRACGFSFVSLDLFPYRTGSMNAALQPSDLQQND